MAQQEALVVVTVAIRASKISSSREEETRIRTRITAIETEAVAQTVRTVVVVVAGTISATATTSKAVEDRMPETARVEITSSSSRITRDSRTGTRAVPRTAVDPGIRAAM